MKKKARKIEDPDLDRLIEKVKEYIFSEDFLSQTEEEKRLLIYFGIPFMIMWVLFLENHDQFQRENQIKELDKLWSR